MYGIFRLLTLGEVHRHGAKLATQETTSKREEADSSQERLEPKCPRKWRKFVTVPKPFLKTFAVAFVFILLTQKRLC